MHSRSGGTDYMATCIYVTNEFDYCFNTIFLKFATVRQGKRTAAKTDRRAPFQCNNTVFILHLIAFAF
ncbi:hypothetical protein ACVIKP_006901 [Rhizobium leguminosarum]